VRQKRRLSAPIFSETMRILDRHFGETHYSLKNLFRDEQFKVLNQILAQTRDEIYNTYRTLTDRYAPLTRFLNTMHAPRLTPWRRRPSLS